MGPSSNLFRYISVCAADFAERKIFLKVFSNFDYRCSFTGGDPHSITLWCILILGVKSNSLASMEALYLQNQ